MSQQRINYKDCFSSNEKLDTFRKVCCVLLMENMQCLKLRKNDMGSGITLPKVIGFTVHYIRLYTEEEAKISIKILVTR